MYLSVGPLRHQKLYAQEGSAIVKDAPASGQTLTQKEYLIAVRNRLFAVEEQIWLHDYAVARPDVAKIEPYSEAKYNELLRVRGELLEEYPVTKLYTDLRDAQQRNLTYAAMYLERLITNFNRQMPISMEHINQIAVLSFSGQVVNLMRGQGAVHHRLLPSNVLTERGIKRQFQHPSFSNKGQYVAFAEMHFKETGESIILSIFFFLFLFPCCYSCCNLTLKLTTLSRSTCTG
jgi:hypothetical protein